jgi:hypothetical protein
MGAKTGRAPFSREVIHRTSRFLHLQILHARAM